MVEQSSLLRRFGLNDYNIKDSYYAAIHRATESWFI